MNPARLVFPGLRWGERGPDDVWPEVRQALDLGVGGFCVFGGSVSGMRETVARALDHAGRPLLFASDLERGAGQQLREATPLPPLAALAGMVDTELLEAARITAQEAAAAGIKKQDTAARSLIGTMTKLAATAGAGRVAAGITRTAATFEGELRRAAAIEAPWALPSFSIDWTFFP